MKKFYISIFLLIFLQACASTSFVEYKPIEINEVIPVQNKNKTEIYTKARQWFTNYFISGESVIDYEDKESGTIIGKGAADNGYVNIVSRSRISYKIKVDTKDNKVRISVSLLNYDISINGDPYTKSNLITAENELTAKNTIEKTLADLKKYILSDEDAPDW
ncbi:DUF4468 domain-containing protein [Rheinheimera nanhaiensis]|uniref:DUF4468 domain-containing protein n=1 Tax=Rheinheimera nanhaiensis E407-8 TaxID=562729 RepID=I1E374_9GAMM|nr:DUF4468 domain-containing protein [Rheinheimera nanhaiensis]GAB60752.1 hypothetical protein RNAN_3779 [Rheinheimera nanhaiensis E407-8]